jgi:hypothetical protein
VAVVTFSLATRLLPDKVGVFDASGTYRLAQPIGYWNGLALFSAMGVLLMLGFVARARRTAVRALAAASLVVLVATIYFTFSRGGWIALAAGLAVAVAVDPRRLQLLATFLVVSPAPAAAVLLASRRTGLTHPGSSVDLAAHDGHRLAVWIVVLATMNAAAAAAFTEVGRRVTVPTRARQAFGAVAALAACVGLGTLLIAEGGPTSIAHKAYASFEAPPRYNGTDLNNRLLTFSGNGRADLWRLAWHDARDHPLLGAGPGTYERYFLAHQPADVGLVRDAHSLYLETLAETGGIGLALLLIFLLTPFAALPRARRHPLVPTAAAAYAAYLVHAAADWDWELPAITVAALVCGSAILLAGRSTAGRVSIPPVARIAAAAIVVAAASFAIVGLVGNTALSRGRGALESGAAARAATDARRARTMMPWSPQPWALLGRSEREDGRLAAARSSFRKAITLDSGDWQTWYDLAGVTSGLERASALRRVAALYPRSGLVAAGKASP